MWSVLSPRQEDGLPPVNINVSIAMINYTHVNGKRGRPRTADLLPDWCLALQRRGVLDHLCVRDVEHRAVQGEPAKK
eukprot:461008-Rhodomonas_salina.2